MDAPPHGLDLVIDFVNTRDVESGQDRIDTPARLAQWLDARGVLDGGAREPSAEDLAQGGTPREALRAEDLTQAVRLREALRAVLHAHTRGATDAEADAVLEQVAERGRLSVRFPADGSVQIAPRASGFAGALARLLVPAAYAALDGTWQRVKACDADNCLEAFYDQSRNRSGRWCDMAVCGNRTKVRAYRAKRPRASG